MVSIIVPIYNTEKYLYSCIDSILTQSYKDFELLLIDDGSTDSSGRICDDYAHKDLRVRVFHNDNKGVGSARNFGLERIRGDYVMFVDSDDELPHHAIDSLFSREADFHVGGCLRLLSSKSQESQEFIPPLKKFYEKEEIELFFDDTFSNMSLLDGPCCKIYKTEIILRYSLSFDEKIHYGEDRLFVFKYLLHTETIDMTTDIVYIQKRREGSLSSDIYTSKHLKQIVEFLSRYTDVVKTYMETFSCNSVQKLYHKDVVQRYVYRYLNILRDQRTTYIPRQDLYYISSLLKADSEKNEQKMGHYIELCRILGKYMPSVFLYLFICILKSYKYKV